MKPTLRSSLLLEIYNLKSFEGASVHLKYTIHTIKDIGASQIVIILRKCTCRIMHIK